MVFLEINRELAAVWPRVNEKKDALPNAERWAGVAGKIAELIR